MWNEGLRQVDKSQTLLLNEQSRAREKEGREVFKFGFGQSPFPPIEAACEALRAHAAAKDYTAVQGLPELRERVAAFHGTVDGIEADAGRVLVGPGSKALLYAVMRAYRRADVLVPVPAWVSYRPQALLAGHACLPVHTSFEQAWRVTPDALEAAVRAKAEAGTPSLLVLNHPGNPEGLGYDEEALKALARTCRRHRILVLSDEIYGLLDHEGAHVSMARHYPEGTIVTGGLSKWCGAGGWRLGVAMLPSTLSQEFRETLLGIASETWSCASLPVQHAACAAYQWNAATRDYLAHQRRLLAALGHRVQQRLAAAGVRVHAPTGGFYLLPGFEPHAEGLRRRGIDSSPALCLRLAAETGVALLPGDAFGLPPGRLCARLAYVDFDGVAALQASREIGLERGLDDATLGLVFGKTLRGIDRLAQWLAAH